MHSSISVGNTHGSLSEMVQMAVVNQPKSSRPGQCSVSRNTQRRDQHELLLKSQRVLVTTALWQLDIVVHVIVRPGSRNN